MTPFGSPTVQHAVIRLPVPPPEGFPKPCGLCSFITFPDGDPAAAVEARFQRAAAQTQRCHNNTSGTTRGSHCILRDYQRFQELLWLFGVQMKHENYFSGVTLI